MSDSRSSPWTDADYAAEFDERAAILEYEGNLSRIEAEIRAAAHVAELRRAHEAAP